ncbi:MAG: sulfotransferase family protein [Woeseiaceae bacterium]
MSNPICLWSGPRNVSTALMYSFAQRDDTRVVDEPLYGHYLQVSGADHPGRDEVIANMNCDGDAVMAELLEVARQDGSRQLFLKHMAHHLVELELRFLDQVRNVFLIRDPREMLPSLTVQIPHAGLADTGLQRQWQLYCALTEHGQRPIVLDSRELLLDPAAVLRQLCDAIDLRFDDCMLHWPAGPITEDGVWAPYWYHAVHQSTGFATYQAKSDFPQKLEPLLEECKPWYDQLFAHAIRATDTGD